MFQVKFLRERLNSNRQLDNHSKYKSAKPLEFKTFYSINFSPLLLTGWFTRTKKTKPLNYVVKNACNFDLISHWQSWELALKKAKQSCVKKKDTRMEKFL